MAVERPNVDRSTRAATRAMHVEPRRSGSDGAPGRWGPQHRSLYVPPLDNPEGTLLGGFVGRICCLVGRTLAHQVGDAWGFAVRAFVGHVGKYWPAAM